MDNISIEDINFRLKKIKGKASEINKKIEINNEKFSARYTFAKDIGIKVDILNDATDEVSNNLNKYVDKVDKLMEKFEDLDNSEEVLEECKLLSNILVLDDAKLKNINELLDDNVDLTTREYINLFASKANDLIRQEEIKSIDENINKLLKINFFEKITGKAKIKKALAENYSLKKVEIINKKYIPDNKSLYEIVSITNNCGYKSKEIDSFVKRIVEEFKLDNPSEIQSLAIIHEAKKIPLFFNKDLYRSINIENSEILNKINKKNDNKKSITEYSVYREMLKNDATTLELLNFENEEVV